MNKLVKELEDGKIVMVEYKCKVVNGGVEIEVVSVLDDDEIMELYGDGNDELMEVYNEEGMEGVERMCEIYRIWLLEEYGEDLRK